MPDLFSVQPSPQQASFFDFTASGQGNAALEACAGAGKTTTLTQGLGQMPGTKFLGAFNTAIAGELEKRVKADDPVSRTITTATMHGAGFGIWRGRHPKARYLRGKIRKVFQEIAVQNRRPFAERYIDYACDMVGYAMNAGLGLDDPRDLQDDKQWLAISEHFDADRALDKKLGANEQVGIQWARATLIRSLEQCPEAVTFDEMLYAPLYNGLSAPRFDNVLIDEAQHSSVPRILLAERMLSEGGRLFAVGDRHQSIYGFAGADSSAMQNIRAVQTVPSCGSR